MRGLQDGEVPVSSDCRRASQAVGVRPQLGRCRASLRSGEYRHLVELLDLSLKKVENRIEKRRLGLDY